MFNIILNVIWSGAMIGNVYFAVKGKDKAQAHCMGIMFGILLAMSIHIIMRALPLLMKG